MDTCGVKIAALQIENVKRVKAFHLQPATNGLTVIGGKNGQGKTTVLDAIAWALGGKRFEPSNPHRDEAMNDPHIEITLSNGVRVERKGKNASLKVIDPSGQKGGQALLDSFVNQFALDLPKFLDADNKKKAEVLLDLLGIGPQLLQMEQDEKREFFARTEIGRIADAKKKHAQELPEYGDAPDAPVSVSALIQSQQAVLARNGENQRKRENVVSLRRDLEAKASVVASVEQQIARLHAQLAAEMATRDKLIADVAIAEKGAAELQDESTAELERQLSEIETINAQVAANAAKAKAADEAAAYKFQYDEKTEAIEKIRAARMALLDGAELPLPGLAVEDGELTYQGKKWDCMASSEQLRVGAAIVRAQKPECGFMLMDKLEQMDTDTLEAFGAWLQAEGLQAISTRVSTGEECSIIIEDGLPQGATYADVVTGVPAVDRGESEWEGVAF